MKKLSKTKNFSSNHLISHSVLIIDNDEDLRVILEEYLTKSFHSFSVESVSDPQKALTLLKKENFDAVLIDYHLDDKTTGLDIVKEIRKTNKFILILMLTGHSSRDLVIESIKLSVDDFVIKPIDFDNFSDTLFHSIEKKKKSFHSNYRTISDQISYNINTDISLFDPFENFVIFYQNQPIYMKGNWLESENLNSKKDPDLDKEQELVSGFIASLQSFSSSFFGQGTLIQEIVLEQCKILFSQIKNHNTNIISAIRLQKENYHYLGIGNNRYLILNTLTKILEGISEIAKFQGIGPVNNFLNQDDIDLINYQLLITNSHLILENVINTNNTSNSNLNVNNKSFWEKLLFFKR